MRLEYRNGDGQRMTFTYRKIPTNETCEVVCSDDTPFPKVNDRIASPFENGGLVTVADVIQDAPRHCFQIFVTD
jgi:hypothetical protein